MPNDGKHQPGYKLPLVIEPDENCCICIPIPNDYNHKMAFLGQLDELGYWWNWERDPLKQGKDAAAVWRKIVACIREDLDMSGCGCGDDKPTNTRINPETGLYEVSYDGGITWEPAPQDDERSSGTVFPPSDDDIGYETRCKGANSALGWLQEIQQKELTGLENNATVAEFITMLIAGLNALGLAFAFVPAAFVALLAFVVNFFARQIAADFEAAFTETVWDDLFCILYCNISPDGSFSEAGWQAVKDELDNDPGNYGLIWMFHHINLIGTVGLTNAARANYAGTRDCDECECAGECNSPSYILNGTLVDSGAGWIEIQATNSDYLGRPGNFITFGATEVGDYCCIPCVIDQSNATLTGAGRVYCNGEAQGFEPVVGDSYLRMEWGTVNVTDTIRIVFSGAEECP